MSDNCPRGNFEQFVSPSSYNRKRILVEFLTQGLLSVWKTHNVVGGPFDKDTYSSTKKGGILVTIPCSVIF